MNKYRPKNYFHRMKLMEELEHLIKLELAGHLLINEIQYFVDLRNILTKSIEKTP